MANTNNLLVLRDKEMISTKTLNSAFQEAYNASSWGREGTILGIGNVTITASTNVSISNVEVSLPAVQITNTDASVQNLKGVIATIGAINITVPVGNEVTVAANFNLVNNTDTMYEGQSPYSAGTGTTIQYNYYIRETQSAYLNYTTAAGTTSVNLFKFKNINGTEWQISPISASSSTLPLFTKVQNPEIYTKVSNLTPETVATVGLVTGLTDNSEWSIRVYQLTATSWEVYFNQVGKGDVAIPKIVKAIGALAANTDYHFFLQYSYINNVISSITAEYYTSVSGNPSLPTGFVQQRVLSFRTDATGAAPKFSHLGSRINMLDGDQFTISPGTTYSTPLRVPRDLPMGVKVITHYGQAIYANGTVQQPQGISRLNSGSIYFTGTGSLSITNTNAAGSGDRNIYTRVIGYDDYTSSSSLKGLY